MEKRGVLCNNIIWRNVCRKWPGKMLMFLISNWNFALVLFLHNFFLQKKAMGSDLYEQVFYSLDLIEKDYFGLQFMDANHVKHWLDPTKAIKKQVKSKCRPASFPESVKMIIIYSLTLSFAVGPPYTLRLKVKFYSSEPNMLREELTRYQFFLQLKQDLLEGRLECSDQKGAELCALALQCKFQSDFNLENCIRF